MYMNETLLEFLTFAGEAKGLRGANLTRRISEVMSTNCQNPSVNPFYEKRGINCFHRLYLFPG